MLKPLKGGFLFQLNYSPLIGKYLVHGEAEEGNFHYKSTNMRRYVDPPQYYFIIICFFLKKKSSVLIKIE